MHDSTLSPDGYEQMYSLYRRDDMSTRTQKRVKVNRPHGLGNILRAFQAGEPMIYALELDDGTIKVGCTTDLAHRRSQLGGDLIGFKFGDFDEEADIHRSLRASRAHGREYYGRTAEVLEFVNELREPYGLAALAS